MICKWILFQSYSFCFICPPCSVLLHRHRSGKDLGKESVRKKNQNATAHNSIRAGFPHLYGTAFYIVAVIGGNAANDESKEYCLDDTHPKEPLSEVVLQTSGQFTGRHQVADIGGGVCTNDSCAHTEYHKEGNHGDQS